MMTTASTRPKRAAPTAMTPVRPIASSMTSPRPEISLVSTIFTMMGVLGACIGRLYSRPERELMVRRAVVAFALVGLIVPTAAQQRDRASIPEKYKWDLTAIYPSNAAWRAAKEKLEADLPGIRQFRGTLGSS